MKKWYSLLGLIVVIMFVLAGCNSNEAGNSAKPSADNTKENSADFEEVTSINLEGPVTSTNFALDEAGEILYWGENDGGIGDDLRRNVWVDGEVQNLDIETWDHFAALNPAGLLVSTETNWEADVDNRHSIIEYDPRTEQMEKFTAANERDNILTVNNGTYNQELRTHIYTDTNPNNEEAEVYLWEAENNEFIDLNFLQDIKNNVGELSNYPHFYLNKDLSTVYAAVLEAGIFSYDIESGKTKELLSLDKLMPQHNTTSMLTTDEKRLIYVTNNTEDYNFIYHALNLETNETQELGKGRKALTLTNGNVAIIEENEVKLFDFETEQLKTIYKVELQENQTLDNVTISLDGSTIAYGYTTDGEEDEEDTSSLSILSNQ